MYVRRISQLIKSRKFEKSDLITRQHFSRKLHESQWKSQLVGFKKKIRVAGCACAIFNTIETLKHVFIKKTFVNTAVVLQVSMVISFHQHHPTSQYLNWHQKEVFFANFWEKTLITLTKMTQILKIRAYLMQNFMELDMENFSDFRALTSGV